MRHAGLEWLVTPKPIDFPKLPVFLFKSLGVIVMAAASPIERGIGVLPARSVSFYYILIHIKKVRKYEINKNGPNPKDPRTAWAPLPWYIML